MTIEQELHRLADLSEREMTKPWISITPRMAKVLALIALDRLDKNVLAQSGPLSTAYRIDRTR